MHIRALNQMSFALTEVACFALVVCSPLFVLFYWIAYEDFDTCLYSAACTAYSEGAFVFFFARAPRINMQSVASYAAWFVFQALLYKYLPGPTVPGPITPGGRQLSYRLNGLLAWITTILTAGTLTAAGFVDPAFVAKNWGGLIATTTIYCLTLVAIFHAKARLAPDNRGETLFTGFFWTDLFNGGELHPRAGRLWDWKHFLCSRTGGIIAWTIIDLSFASHQLCQYGHLTNSMVLVVFLRMWIVADFFVNEDWFFHTLDGMHETFGFYNIYGFSGMMPVIWTLQTQYLSNHPVELSNISCLTITVIWFAGWSLRYSADRQKLRFRREKALCTVWGKPAKGIRASYRTKDGAIHEALLLCSGWWGTVRHANYVGSMVYTWAHCIACGSGAGLFAHTEAVIVVLLILFRVYRDDKRCEEKYGESWKEYKRIVPWMIVPGIF